MSTEPSPTAHADTGGGESPSPPGCDGAGCNGLDPIKMGCSADACTAAAVSTPLGYLQLRYSPSCHANWARLTAHPGYPIPPLFGVMNADNDSEEYSPAGYTNMVNGYPRAYAYVTDSFAVSGAARAYFVTRPPDHRGTAAARRNPDTIAAAHRRLY